MKNEPGKQQNQLREEGRGGESLRQLYAELLELREIVREAEKKKVRNGGERG